MKVKRAASPLSSALESFGRRARRLDAARLESFPEVLVILYDDSIANDSKRRREAALEVEGALRSIIESIEDSVDRRIAETIFSSSPEFFDKTVAERQAYVYSHDCNYTLEQFKTHRARIVGDVASALERVIGNHSPNKAAELSPKARRFARQLYWYLQQTLVRLEAFNHVALTASSLKDGSTYREKIVATTRVRNVYSDIVLWNHAHCLAYLKALLADETGRNFLRENLPDLWWRKELNTPFVDYEASFIRTILANSPIDEATPFVDNLCDTKKGRDLHERWVEFLSELPEEDCHRDDFSDRSVAEYRYDLFRNLFALAKIFEEIFAEDTIPPQDTSRVFNIITFAFVVGAPLDAGLVFDDEEGHQIYQAMNNTFQKESDLRNSNFLSENEGELRKAFSDSN